MAEGDPINKAAQEPTEEKEGPVMIHSLLKGLVKHKASDLHVKMGRPPLYRINGKLLPAKTAPLSSEDVKRLAYSTMTQIQIKEFEQHLQIDFGYLVPNLARFRANVFMQKGTLAFVIRVVPLAIPSLEQLFLPTVLQDLALKSRGLLLVTGATGSGKSTTLAALIDFINRNCRAHIVTIEDPIEFVFEDKMSTLSQREIGVDAVSMPLALRGALRQDPDVIMVGEMRDYQTMQTAISAAETGHLVLSTLHTNTAASSIDRILDSFPADAKNQLRLQLANSLIGVVSQRLVKKLDGTGRMVACEILTKSPTVEKLIIENKVNEVDVVMESSNVYYKMQSMNQALERLVRDGKISQEEAISNSDKREDLILKLSGVLGGGQGGVDATEIMSQTKNMNVTRGTGGVLREVEDAESSAPSSGIQVEGQASRGNPRSSGDKTAAIQTGKKLSDFFKKKPA